jgi:hypothetical protein
MICMKYKNHSVLKNLNTLYPGDIKGIHKNENVLSNWKKHLREKGFPLSRYYFVARKQNRKPENQRYHEEKAKLINR